MMVNGVPDVTLSTQVGDGTTCDADFVVLPVFEGDRLDGAEALDAAAGGDVSRALQSREFRAQPFDLYLTPLEGRARRLLCVGCGPRDKLTTERVRKVATAAGWAVRQRGGRRVAFVVRNRDGALDPDTAASAEGLVLAGLGSDRHKSTPSEVAPLESALVLTPNASGEAHAARGAVIGRCTNLARWLSDAPGNVLTPDVLAEQARAVLAGTSITVDVLDEQRLALLKMGLMLAVGKGSVEPPRLIVMRYTPAAGAGDRVLGLVGKGVTFDTGGISIKLAEGMEKMKHDMSGGAAVIAAMRAIAELKPSVAVIGVVPAVENMPGGRAFKPGDILTSAAGKTVEVVNTDAEGRLILGDALWFARQQGATHLVDVATLTGACVIALGRVCSGLFGAPDDWVDTVSQAAARAGERVWPLPVDDDYAEALKSDFADMTNSGGRAGGAIAGAMFLREFAGTGPWAHLDVAGTAWADEAKPWQPKGATGVSVRTMVELAMSADRWSSA